MAINFAVVADGIVPITFPKNFFPRGYHFRTSAGQIVTEMQSKGGQAHIVPRKQFTAELIRQLRKE